MTEDERTEHEDDLDTDDGLETTDGLDGAGAHLRVLMRRTATTTGWRAPDVVRRGAVTRRRRRVGYGTTAVIAAAAAAVSVFAGRGADPAPALAQVPGVHVGSRVAGAVQLVSNDTSRPGTDTQAIRAVVSAQQQLALKLLQRLGGRGNVSVSPASLQLALGMLQNGARGQTASQIAQALQSPTLTTQQQNAGLAGLTTELRRAAERAGITLEAANSLWQQRGLRVRHAFLAALATYYRTGVWQADFAGHNAAAVAAINRWTSQHTHGRITKLFDGLDPSTVLVLADAMYFHAAWASPFDSSDTAPGSFTTGTGQHVQAKFMSGGGFRTAVTSGYSAVQLPYQGKRFAALAVMPTSGTLPQFVAGLTPAALSSIASSTASTDTRVLLPRFTTRSDSDLVPILQALGMRDAFGTGADLSGLSPRKTSVDVDQVVQRVYLGVGEKGTTAAAVTGISVSASSLTGGPQPITFDRPFLFLVRDTVTGAILFASEIDDPTAG